MYAHLAYNSHMKNDTRIYIRLTESEKNAFQDAADIGGLSLSSWIRERLRRACVQELRSIDRIPEFLEYKTKGE
ncbi:MAG: hypothetical protein AMXMBFR84_04630 [Candidatus Hydrogenedentota bacterium]